MMAQMLALRTVVRRSIGVAVVLLLMVAVWSAQAGEIATNGTGGGAWSDKATWKGGVVPGPEDEVTIRKGDAVVFDRDDGGAPLAARAAQVATSCSQIAQAQGRQAVGGGLVASLLDLAGPIVAADNGKTTCAKLFIDPQGALRFKTGIGRVVFVVSGPVESFGLIKLDGSTSADDFHELRFTGKTPKEREAKFDKGGFIVSGKAKLPGARHNVLISSWPPDLKAAEPWASIDVKSGTIDVQHADFQDVKLAGDDIDNTGSKVGERCNIVGNHFRGRANIFLVNCDTPVVADNSLRNLDGPMHLPAAIYLSGCALAEVKNNSVIGTFFYGFTVYGCTDAVVTGNTVEKAAGGIYCVGAAMFKGNTFREIPGAFAAILMNGTIADCVFEKCLYAVHVNSSTVQISDCVYRDPPKDGRAIDFLEGAATLINCDFGPESVTLPKMLPKTDKPLVTAMDFFILKVNGDVPEDSQVDVRTTKPDPPLAAGAADLNVRNAPAPLVGNRTPLPQSLSPIILRSWVIDKDGKKLAAPQYTVRVLAAAEGDKERKVLKTLSVTPERKWFRAKPNDPAPTLEVNLK
jgi:hypothetical protein